MTELTHCDNMGNQQILTRGQAHYLSAGTGIQHSENNLGKDVSRFLQIWILPDRKGHVPNYDGYAFEWSDRANKWLQIVSPVGGSAPVQIHQDVNLYVFLATIKKWRLYNDKQLYKRHFAAYCENFS